MSVCFYCEHDYPKEKTLQIAYGDASAKINVCLTCFAKQSPYSLATEAAFTAFACEQVDNMPWTQINNLLQVIVKQIIKNKDKIGLEYMEDRGLSVKHGKLFVESEDE